MKKTKKNHKGELVRVIEYLVSGGAYFWSGYSLYFILDKGLHTSFFWAKATSTLAGWTINFLLQRYWVFKNPKFKTHQTQITTRYAVITLVDFALDYALVYGLKVVGVTPYIGQFVSAGFFTGWNYLWYRYWVFPEKFNRRHSAVRTRIPRLVAHRPHGHSAYYKGR